MSENYIWNFRLKFRHKILTQVLTRISTQIFDVVKVTFSNLSASALFYNG